MDERYFDKSKLETYIMKVDDGKVVNYIEVQMAPKSACMKEKPDFSDAIKSDKEKTKQLRKAVKDPKDAVGKIMRTHWKKGLKKAYDKYGKVVETYTFFQKVKRFLGFTKWKI